MWEKIKIKFRRRRDIYIINMDTRRLRKMAEKKRGLIDFIKRADKEIAKRKAVIDLEDDEYKIIKHQRIRQRAKEAWIWN